MDQLLIPKLTWALWMAQREAKGEGIFPWQSIDIEQCLLSRKAMLAFCTAHSLPLNQSQAPEFASPENQGEIWSNRSLWHSVDAGYVQVYTVFKNCFHL